jgi:hypothetical protein
MQPKQDNCDLNLAIENTEWGFSVDPIRGDENALEIDDGDVFKCQIISI